MKGELEQLFDREAKFDDADDDDDDDDVSKEFSTDMTTDDDTDDWSVFTDDRVE